MTNYVKAFQRAVEIVMDYTSYSLPVDLNEVVENINRRSGRYSGKVRLSTYAKLGGAKRGKSILGSRFGAIVSFQNNSIIYYNDEIKNPFLTRFTIAHELGHYFLGHQHLAGFVEHGDFKSNSTAPFEREANVFARNLLAPATLVKRVLEAHDALDCTSESDYAVDLISNTFAISREAARIRIETLSTDIRLAGGSLPKMPLFSTADWRSCNLCGSVRYWGNTNSPHITGSHCEVCGNDLNFRWNYTHPAALIGKAVKVYPKAVTLRCTCGHYARMNTYCPNCGDIVRNLCENVSGIHEGTYVVTDPGARFCTECASPTTFGRQRAFADLKPKTMYWQAFAAQRAQWDSEYR